MILENKIVQALKFFGAMSKNEIDDKLRLIGMYIECRDLDHAINLLMINKMIRVSDAETNKYIAK